MGNRLLVEVSDFVDASITAHDAVAEPLWLAYARLCAALQGQGGMAGGDPGGLAWAAEYDGAASSAVQATALAVGASYRLSALFGRSGQNYASADAASTPGVRHNIETQIGRLPAAVTIGPAVDPPSAAGGGLDLPTGWDLIGSVVNRLWPDGHQDRLLRAAQAWTASAQALDDAVSPLRLTTVTFARDRLPEYPDMHTVCAGLCDHLLDLAGTHRALARACRDLARHLDECHAAVISELTDLIAWTAGIQVVGGILGVVTAGIAEVPAQAAQLARIAATAARVGVLIDRFLLAARAVLAGLPTVKLAADAVALTLERLRSAEILLAGMDSVPILSGAAGAGRAGALSAKARAELAAEARLASARPLPPKLEGRQLGDDGVFTSARSLRRHFAKHGRQMRAATAEDYCRASTNFLQRALDNGLPRRVDPSDGTIRVFDPSTKEFGSFRSDGATITYFPATRAYFDRQPGPLS